MINIRNSISEMKTALDFLFWETVARATQEYANSGQSQVVFGNSGPPMVMRTGSPATDKGHN